MAALLWSFNMVTIAELNKVDLEIVEMCEEENKEIKRKIMEIDAQIATCQNKRLELEEKIKANIDFMKTMSKPWLDA